MAKPFRNQMSADPRAGSSGVPLVRAGQLSPFADAAERLGIRTERYLDQARLPISVLEHPQQMIPRAQLWDFADGIAREQGLPGYGLEAATTDPVATLGAFGHRILTEPTLWMALARLAGEFGRHSTHACIRLEGLPEGVRVIRHDAGYLRNGSDVVEQYTLMLLLSVIRRAAPTWLPERLWIRSAAPAWAAQHDLLADTERVGGSPVTGIFVPREIMARPMRRQGLARADGTAEAKFLVVPGGFLGPLKHALQPLVGQMTLDLNLAAEMVGASPRTVRLRLREEGTSWRRLLDDLRFEHASGRLIETDTRIGDVAFELGYADAAHFIRAFRRWTHLTPREFRLAMSQAQNEPDEQAAHET